MAKTRIKSCLGCYAHEFSLFNWGTDYCQLGHTVKKIEGVAGHYGKGGQLISCNCAPVEQCPKPRTERKFLDLWRKQIDEQ